MKKIIIFISCIFLVGCSCSNDLAADAAEEYLNAYQSLKDNVLADMDELVKSENLNAEQSENYKKVLKRQYSDMMYTIENESYNGDNAKVTVKITVYDLYKGSKEAKEYLNSHREEFITDGEYDVDKYIDYRLEKLNNINETVTYNIVFNCIKKDSKWQVEQPNNETLEKIHGIYNYEE